MLKHSGELLRESELCSANMHALHCIDHTRRSLLSALNHNQVYFNIMHSI